MDFAVPCPSLPSSEAFRPSKIKGAASAGPTVLRPSAAAMNVELGRPNPQSVDIARRVLHVWNTKNIILHGTLSGTPLPLCSGGCGLSKTCVMGDVDDFGHLVFGGGGDLPIPQKGGRR